jgi:hypothetical protein
MGVYHASLGPSGAPYWSVCTAKPGAEKGRPNTSNDASRNGTCGHQIGEDCLRQYLAGLEFDTDHFVGRKMAFFADGSSDWLDKFPAGVAPTHTLDVDQALADAANAYARHVIQIHKTVGGELLIEQRVSIGWITGEEGATGSSDAIIIAPDGTIYVIDAKFGRGKVYAYDIIQQEQIDPITEEVTPPVRRINLQLGMYALGAWHEHSAFHDIKRVVAVIVQPFLNSVSQYECSVEELLDLGKWLSERAEETRSNPTFVPNNKNCFFCRARFDCHARNADVLKTALDGFDDVDSFAAAKTVPIFLPNLGQLWGKVDQIAQWCKDIETKVQAELEAGNVVIGPDGGPLKLVEGRKPHKAWSDEQAAMEMMSTFRLKELMWNKKLITPAQAEKLAPKKPGKKPETEPKTPIGKTQWKRLSALVTQGRGNPTVAAANDPRPALLNNAQDMPEVPDDNSDLF